MTWFFIAIIGPILWSIVNHIDKFFLEKHFKGESKGSLIIFSTLFTVVFLPFFYLFDSGVFSISLKAGLILILAGFINTIAIFFYLCALDIDEASVAVPIIQTVPIFALVLSYFINNELPTITQIIGILIIIFGSVVLTLELDSETKIRVKGKVLLYGFLSAFFYALMYVVFKFGVNDNDFWKGMTWEIIGLVISGIVLFIFVKSYRKDFIRIFQSKGKGLIGLNVFSEALTILGNAALNFSVLLAPVGLVLVVDSFQPIFVFIIGTILTLSYPHLVKEKITKSHLTQKVTAILIVLIGCLMI